MRIETFYKNSVQIYDDDNERITVYKILSGCGLSANGYPYAEYIAEWEYTPYQGDIRKTRELIVLPQKNTADWLKEFVHEKERSGYTLTGIMPLYEIVLAKPLM